ncbi:hypothetical protein GA0115233_100399 [Streptomyces sp. DI166]|uniref:hypothetical protein n=1 Tax=unclassified Streptomyces TaxID=2593676 RepID=UPI0007F50A05|nr:MULTISPECIES: hypothetical protein [unclassified Streptomyces]SBT88577.1 hypothetical protein GA0115233_100399 [Streptomyces sp. DI166]
MGGSAKPRRRRAAAPALRYERQPKRPQQGRTRSKRDAAFGCLAAFTAMSALIGLFLLDRFWGDDTWQWAAGSWPGGAYGFAGFLGFLGPSLLVVFGACAYGLGKKSLRRRPVRTAALTLTLAVSVAALVPYVVLVLNALDSGKLGKGEDTEPSWVSAHYPWLWALGLLSTLLTVTVFLAAATLHHRHRTRHTQQTKPAATPLTHEELPQSPCP